MHSSTYKNSVMALGLLFILGLIWGSGYSLAHYATTHGVSPLGYAFWQSLGPAIFLLITTFITQHRLIFSRQHLLFYLICGLIGVALPNVVVYFAAAHLPAGLLAVIVNTVPIVTYILAYSGGLERFYIIRFCGVLLGMAGILLLVLPKANLPSPELVPWVLLALLAPLCFATAAVYAAKYRPATNSLALAAGMMLVSAILLTPVVLLKHSFYPLWPPLAMRDWVIILEIILSSLGYILFFQLLKIAGPVYYSLVDGVVALTGLFWGWLIFGETLKWGMALAVLLILIAIVLVTWGQWSQTIKD